MVPNHSIYYTRNKSTHRFVVEDFIHVIDTLRFLMGTEVKDVKVECLKEGETLNSLVIQLIGEGYISIGIMNRNGGVTEEIIEYSTGKDKYVVNSLYNKYIIGQ